MPSKPSSNKTKDKKKTGETTAQTTPLPNWPSFAPLVPKEDLGLTTLLPRQIITVSNLWTSTLCKNYISFLTTLPLTTTPGKPKKGDAVRVNDRFQVDDARFADRLWRETGLEYLVTTDEGSGMSEKERTELWGGDVVGLNPNIRIYRYSKGQFFDQHYDDSNTLNFTSPATGAQAIPAKTTWTLLLYLTSPTTGCTGGETVFYPEPASKRDAPSNPVVVDLEVGMALLHRHGKECMLHEGREVTAGEKWVVRSDLCVRR